MKKFILILIFLMSFLSKGFAGEKEQEILFLSDQRCGTHYCLYCIGYFLDKEVIMNRGTCQIRLFDEIFYEHKEGVIYSGHNPKDLWISQGGQDKDILIMIVRNYRECLYRDRNSVEAVLNEIRHMATFNHMPAKFAFIQPHNHYFNNLRCFDFWDPSLRLMIYYEDLITNPEMVFQQILTFFNKSHEQDLIEDFMENLQEHIDYCLNYYESQGGSKTQGKDVLYYTKIMGLEGAKAIDDEVKALHPEIFDKYLRRYELVPD